MIPSNKKMLDFIEGTNGLCIETRPNGCQAKWLAPDGKVFSCQSASVRTSIAGLMAKMEEEGVFPVAQ